MDLRAVAAMSNKEGFAREIGPGDGRLGYERMQLRHHRQERFGPYAKGQNGI